ncbi:DUF2147 domain-containing protein [Olivibacter sitiensis]|uniref:DUF2147 domain-containing protein n=1 Tax=Olivibacter sitiensis TaxID=376470 RepID=UPI0004869078|nr:DUF2147 domain-containing protein [Olivibacter sitiensis]
MKKLLVMMATLLLAGFLAAQDKDAVLGKWQNPSGEGRVEISKRDGKYFGKLYWLKEPNDESGKPKLDVKNPDESLRKRQIQGLEILKDFDAKDKGVYENGTIYDPKSGKTYSCKMTLKGEKLDIRGYVGVSLLGRTESWTRVK